MKPAPPFSNKQREVADTPDPENTKHSASTPERDTVPIEHKITTDTKKYFCSEGDKEVSPCQRKSNGGYCVFEMKEKLGPFYTCSLISRRMLRCSHVMFVVF